MHCFLSKEGSVITREGARFEVDTYAGLWNADAISLYLTRQRALLILCTAVHLPPPLTSPSPTVRSVYRDICCLRLLYSIRDLTFLRATRGNIILRDNSICRNKLDFVTFGAVVFYFLNL